LPASNQKVADSRRPESSKRFAPTKALKPDSRQVSTWVGLVGKTSRELREMESDNGSAVRVVLLKLRPGPCKQLMTKRAK